MKHMQRYLDGLKEIHFTADDKLGPHEEELKGKPYEAITEQLRQGNYSDIKDSFEHQYVDLVMEGGGMLGIALLGYTFALEQCGIRFWSIAGTSAGAITAALLAGVDERQEARSEKVLAHLAKLNTDVFVDGAERTRKFAEETHTHGFALGKAVSALRAGGVEAAKNLMKDGMSWTDLIAEEWTSAWSKLGLNPGKAFEDWVTAVLSDAGIITYADLKARVEKYPPGVSPTQIAPPDLAIIAADLTTQSKVQFPRDAPLYWKKADDVSPALFVRASMAVPLFFEPLKLRDLPLASEHPEKWRTKGYTGILPDEVLLVDGGIVSNFPINVFHSPRVPVCPTFGAKLGRERESGMVVKNPKDLMLACFDQSRNSLDRDFLERNVDYNQLVSIIDTGKHGWLNFKMDEEAKVDLFRRGAKAALRFLHGFNWESYKNLRKELVAALSAAKLDQGGLPAEPATVAPVVPGG